MAQLTILHTNDIHSRFEAWARMETLVRPIRAELGRDALLRVDAGDHSDRSVPLTEATRGQVNMALLAAAGVDAFTLGDQESLVWPVAHQTALAQAVPFSVMAADVRLQDGSEVPGLTDRAVVCRSGLKIGLFGLSRDTEEHLAVLGLSHRSPMESARECVRELRVDGCDLVICVSHLGYQMDTTLALAVSGIDVIVGGHSHTVLPAGELVGSTILVQTGGYGQYLGRLDLTVEGKLITAWQAQLLDPSDAEPDAATLESLQEWGQAGVERLAEVVAYLPAPLTHDPLGESPLAELMARRLQVKFGAEVGLVHGGVLLAGLRAGPVTRGDLLRVCPCILNPTVADVPGQKLLDLAALPLEAVRHSVKGKGMRGATPIGRLFWSGLERVEPGRTYRVALNGYLAMGLEPYEALDGATRNVACEVDQLMRDTLREALTGQVSWSGEPVRVESWDLGGRRKKYVDATLVCAGPEETVLRAGPGYRIYYDGGEPVDLPYAIDYHFWPGRQYNLFRLFDREGNWVVDYYNVAMPFAGGPGTIRYVDLELDVAFWANKPPELLDEAELAAAAYPVELKARVREVARSLMAIVATDLRPGGPIWPRPLAKDFAKE